MTEPLVSVIVPCRNEAAHIRACLASITASDYPAARLEILVVDGASDDGTREALDTAAANDARIAILDNPRQTAPIGLNLAIAQARGDVIMRMDAHCEYAPGYIPALVRALNERGADNVGGVTEVVASGPGAIAAAIALALSHPAGVGNSYFRVGANEPRWVDTVPFGCWRRDTFERVGLFDESLPRNQDDEFNMRIRAAGGRILLLPEVRTRYYARRTLGQLWRMFSQYGYYKPLTAIRARSRLRPRQFAPAVLVLALVTGVALLPFSVWPLLICTTTYVLFVLGAAIPIAVTSGPSVGVAFAAALVVMHGGYGIGFLRGVVQFAILRRHEPAPAASLSR